MSMPYPQTHYEYTYPCHCLDRSLFPVNNKGKQKKFSTTASLLVLLSSSLREWLWSRLVPYSLKIFHSTVVLTREKFALRKVIKMAFPLEKIVVVLHLQSVQKPGCNQLFFLLMHMIRVELCEFSPINYSGLFTCPDCSHRLCYMAGKVILCLCLFWFCRKSYSFSMLWLLWQCWIDVLCLLV